MSVEAQTFGPNPSITEETSDEAVAADGGIMEAAAELLDPAKYNAIVHGYPEGAKAAGPRRPRVHNARLFGSKAFTEVPAKTDRQRRNRAQRQARKVNHGR